MDKKMRSRLLLLGVYILVFLIGYKSGAIYTRMTEMDSIVKMSRAIMLPTLPPSKYFIVTKYIYDTHTSTTYDEVDDAHALIKIFRNEKLRPLLKARDLQIYKDTGERIY